MVREYCFPRFDGRNSKMKPKNREKDEKMDVVSANLKRKAAENASADAIKKASLSDNKVESGKNLQSQVLTNPANSSGLVLENNSKTETVNDKGDFSAVDNVANKNNAAFGHTFTQQQSEVITAKTPDFYKENNKGPFGVWVRKIRKDDVELNQYKVGSILFLNYKTILEIRRKDKFRVEVMFSNANEANKLLADKTLANHNLEVFIPDFRKCRKGIIKGIPADLAIEKIKEACKSEIEICDVYRLNRRNPDKASDDKWIPSSSIVVSFIGQNLPTEIFVFNVKSYVNPFVSKPKQCFNCFAFVHTKNICKHQKRCIYCGKEEKENCCSKVDYHCIHCQKDHRSTDYKCEIYEKHLRINTLMAYYNIPFIEAKKIIIPEAQRPPLDTKENFPNLKNNANVKYYSKIASDYSTQVKSSKAQAQNRKNQINQRMNTSYNDINQSSSYVLNINEDSSTQQSGSNINEQEYDEDPKDFILSSQPAKKNVSKENSLHQKNSSSSSPPITDALQSRIDFTRKNRPGKNKK